MRRAAFFVSWVFTATVLLFVAANLAAAVANRIHFNAPPPLPPHPTLGHPIRPVPNRNRLAAAPIQHARFHVDADGWRQDGARDTRVTLFGGSAAFGFYVDDEDTIAHALRAFNAAQMGYALRDELVVFRDLLERDRAPRVAIFYDGANEKGHLGDGAAARVDGPFGIMDYGAWELAAAERAYGRLVNLEHLPLALLVERIAGRLWPRPALAAGDHAAVIAHAEAAAENYAVNQRLIRALGAAAGVRVVFVLQPLAACLAAAPPHAVYPVPDVDRVYYPRLYAAIERRARVDASWCAAMPATAFKTPIHLGGDGNRRVAAMLRALAR